MNEILVSVLCITYNHAPYIAQALDSFINQKSNYRFEILVHDDASTDGTIEILHEYQRRYPEIIRLFIERENQFNNPNRPKGGYFFGYLLPHAKGSYVMLCEGDDYWCDSHKMEKQIAIFEANSEITEVCHSSYVVNGKNDERLGLMGMGDKSHVLNPSEVVSKWQIPTSSVMIKKDTLELYVNNWWQTTYPVGDFPLAVYEATQGIVYYSSEPMSVYRFRTPGSYTSRMQGHKQKFDNSYSWIDMLDDLDSKTNRALHNEFISKMKDHVRVLATQAGVRRIMSPLIMETLRHFTTSDWIKLITLRGLWVMGFSFERTTSGTSRSGKIKIVRHK